MSKYFRFFGNGSEQFQNIKNNSRLYVVICISSIFHILAMFILFGFFIFYIFLYFIYILYIFIICIFCIYFCQTKLYQVTKKGLYFRTPARRPFTNTCPKNCYDHLSEHLYEHCPSLRLRLCAAAPHCDDDDVRCLICKGVRRSVRHKCL